MKYNFCVKDTTLTDSLYKYIEQKFSHFDKYLDEHDIVYVRLEVKKHEKNPQKVEVTIHKHDKVVRGECRDNDMYSAIDQVEESVVRSLRKMKEKQIQKHRKETAPTAEQTFVPELIDRKKYHAMEYMTQEMAIDEMEMTQHSFYVYRDVDKDNAVCAVYVRENGTYGVLIYY